MCVDEEESRRDIRYFHEEDARRTSKFAIAGLRDTEHTLPSKEPWPRGFEGCTFEVDFEGFVSFFCSPQTAAILDVAA